MKSSITSPLVTKLLDSLYADAAIKDPQARQAAENSGRSGGGEANFYKTAMRTAYMPVGREFGRLLYNLARNGKAKTVVEFGTSFGISTIYLASAIRDNGEGGKVITSEFAEEKAAKAKENLTESGLVNCVEFRVGDALQTLAYISSEIDMIFLDGAKGLYLDVLKLLEPRLRSGGIIASDNTDHDGMEAFLEYIRNPANGYTSSSILTDREQNRGHEITVRN